MSKKRILSFLLAFCMLISVISIDAVVTAAEPTNVALSTNGTTITSNRISSFGEENDLGLGKMIDGDDANFGITEECDKDDETTLDLIFKQSYLVSKVRMRTRELSTNQGYATAPVDYTLSVWTSNGWKEVKKVVDHVQSESNEWIEHEFEAVACRAVRLSVTEHGCDGGNTYAIYLREFEAYGVETTGGIGVPVDLSNVALASNGTMISSNHISFYGESHDLGLDEMIDGVGSNYGITEGCDKDDETTLDLIFKQSYAVSKVRMRVRELSTDPVYATAPVDYTLSVWTANGWKAVVKVEDHVQSKSNEWIEHEFEAVACRAVRLSVTEHGCDGGNTYAIYLREFEAYGIPTEEVVATPPAQGMFYNVTATIYDAREGQYGIVWHSTKNLAEPKIQVVSEKDKNNFDESLGEYDVTVSSSEGYYIYKGIISGLEASTCYYYRVGDTSVNLFSEWGSFVTSSLDESAFTFFHMTDTQNYYSQWNTVLSSAFSLYDDAKLIVHTGDLVEWGPDAGEWKTAFDTTKDYLSNTLLTSIAGSHHESQGTELYDHFNFKVPNSQDPDGGLYYSYDYNNVHFTMIDINDYSSESEQLSPTQIQWLIQDLKNTDKEWKVVGLHWSMYSAGLRLNFAEIAAIRAQLEPIFSEYNVDLVLSGHDHVYTRTYPIKNGAVVQDIETSLVTIGGKETSFDVNPNGTVYLLSSTSGGTFYELKYSGEWFSAKDGQPNQSMFSAITVDGDKLIINAYTVDQNTGATQLYDTYAMMKTKIESDDDLKDDETTYCDKTQLNSAIESAKALKRGDYTKDSYEVLKAALVKAEAVFQNSEATQAVVDEATTQLLVAIDKLVKKELPVLDSQENESQKAEPPATGDNNNLGVLFLVAFLAVMGISVVIDNKRRRNS